MPYMICVYDRPGQVFQTPDGPIYLQRKVVLSGYRRTKRALVPIDQGTVFPDTGSATRAWRAAERYGGFKGLAQIVEVSISPRRWHDIPKKGSRRAR